jgi:hypothetical protein
MREIYRGTTLPGVPEYELLGLDDAETRVLRERTTGYSVAIPGYPALIPVVNDGPRYDALVQLRALPARLGFRIDGLPTALDPKQLARTLATSFAASRAVEPPFVKPMPTTMRPASSAAGADAVYPIRDTTDPTIEQIWIVLRPSPIGMWALYHTTWFRTADVNTIHWGHLRASMVDQHEWDPADPRDAAPQIWPTSTIGKPSARLDLTDDGWGEAQAKAAEVGSLTPHEVTTVAEVMTDMALSDQPPRLEVAELRFDAIKARISMAIPPQAAGVLLRNLGECRTMLDLRAWCWQCAWAVGNRNEARDRSS